jgi:hypothetical protein
MSPPRVTSQELAAYRRRQTQMSGQLAELKAAETLRQHTRVSVELYLPSLEVRLAGATGRSRTQYLWIDVAARVSAYFSLTG